jgi:hypothetical protein
MRSCLVTLAVFLLGVSLGAGSPVEPVKPGTATLGPYRRLVESRVFAGGQRANVIVIGQGSSNVGLYIYDGYGNCVSWDDQGTAATRDDAAAIWFPLQDERYTIELRNLGAATNRLDIVVR